MKDQVIVEVSIVPLGTASPSVSQYVAACHQVLRKAEGISHQLTPMGTILQGPLQSVLAVVQQMHEVPFEMGAQRVSTLIKIDDRRDKRQAMGDKVQAVQRRLE
jgi:uncharacterized protein (TIGR00106 family)